MAWNPITSPCDYILLDRKRSPGIAEVSGASSIRRWDEREGFGISGAWIVYKGRGLAKFSVTIRLATVDDWAAWHAWRPLVDKLPARRFGAGRDSGSLDIWHPYLEDLDVRSVCVAEVMQPVIAEDGTATVEIKFIEFRQPRMALAKPEGAPAEEVDPIEERVIKPLQAQFDRLANE